MDKLKTHSPIYCMKMIGRIYVISMFSDKFDDNEME